MYVVWCTSTSTYVQYVYMSLYVSFERFKIYRLPTYLD